MYNANSEQPPDDELDELEAAFVDMFLFSLYLARRLTDLVDSTDALFDDILRDARQVPKALREIRSIVMSVKETPIPQHLLAPIPELDALLPESNA